MYPRLLRSLLHFIVSNNSKSSNIFLILLSSFVRFCLFFAFGLYLENSAYWQAMASSSSRVVPRPAWQQALFDMKHRSKDQTAVLQRIKWLEQCDPIIFSQYDPAVQYDINGPRLLQSLRVIELSLFVFPLSFFILFLLVSFFSFAVPGGMVLRPNMPKEALESPQTRMQGV